MKDTFHTFTYKGMFIHTHQDRDLNRAVVTWQDETYSVHKVPSVRSAKLAITKHLKEKA